MSRSTTPQQPDARPARGRLLLGGLAGLLSGAAGVLLAEGLTALLSGVPSPILAVGNRAVDETPRPLKEFAVETFGESDKAVLLGGMLATIALLTVAAGMVGVRRPRVGLAAFLLLGAVAIAAAATDRAAGAGPLLRVLPALVLTVVATVALLTLLRTLRAPHRSRSSQEPRASTAPTGAEGSAASSPDEQEKQVEQVEQVETLDGGKPRMLVREVLPSHVAGDDLPAAFDRRAFMQAALAVGAVAAVGGVARQAFGGAEAVAARADVSLPRPASAAAPLPAGATLDVPGITPYLTRNKNFYRVDTALKVPDVPVEGFNLRIHGMVDKELELSFADLLERRLVERRITLTCVSNPVGGKYVDNATWLGVPMRDLLAEAGVQDGADAVKSTSADDMTIGTPLPALTDPDRDALVAVGMNGEPLPLEHGFPVRMVTPGLYGYVSATKWLVDLEVTRFADFKAYWTTRGYAEEAPIKTSSRIDVPRPFANVKAGSQVPVAGVAWSQDRGIEKVEVRVDGGPWREARLAEEDNIDTWRQWVWMWEPESGNHQLEVRATDRTGYTQTAERAPIAPDGSTGWHSVNVTAA